MIEYLACGNIMSDNVIAADGTESGWHIGGPALFALAGARLYTDKCKLVCRTGADYVDSYKATTSYLIWDAGGAVKDPAEFGIARP